MASLFVQDHFKEPRSKATLIPICMTFDLPCIFQLVTFTLYGCLIFCIAHSCASMRDHSPLNTCKHFVRSSQKMNHSSITVNEGKCIMSTMKNKSMSSPRFARLMASKYMKDIQSFVLGTKYQVIQMFTSRTVYYALFSGCEIICSYLNFKWQKLFFYRIWMFLFL